MSFDIITLGLAKSYTDHHGGGGGQVQPDWNQNDETAADYVKNRTHWEEVKEVSVIAETTVTISEDMGCKLLPKTTQLTVGQTYLVIMDGVSYECVAWYSDSEEAVIIGNGAICGGEGGNGEPFSCDSYSSGEIYLNTEKAGTYTISISTKENIIHKLDKKYLPDEVIDSIDNAQSTANSAYDLANTANTKANNISENINRKAELREISTTIDITDAFSINVGEAYKKEQAGFIIPEGSVTVGLNNMTFSRTKSNSGGGGSTSFFYTLMTAANLYNLHGLLVCKDTEEIKVFIIYINNIRTTSTLFALRVA